MGLQCLSKAFVLKAPLLKPVRAYHQGSSLQSSGILGPSSSDIITSLIQLSLIKPYVVPLEAPISNRSSSTDPEPPGSLLCCLGAIVENFPPLPPLSPPPPLCHPVMQFTE